MHVKKMPRIKLIAKCNKTDNKVFAYVMPRFVSVNPIH